MVQKFRKKPAVIEAIQFTRHTWKEVLNFTSGNAINYRCEKCIGGKAYCDIKTLEGTMLATERDYIIKGVAGEFYPCKPDIFEQTYEKLTIQ